MDRWVRSLRGPKSEPVAWRPLRVVHEQERRPRGGMTVASTVFLVGKECPFSCVFCDLWKDTLPGLTPPGSLPRQLELALSQISQRSLIKLYNASNFFDPSAVPPCDYEAILELLRGFQRVTVECHPRFVGERCFKFADRLNGTLEVAIGLETTHPDALPRLNKQMTLTNFDAAAAMLSDRQIPLRVFVLLGCPFIPSGEQLEWTLRSVDYAVHRGAAVISIIPVRGGNGALEALEAKGAWSPVSLDLVEAVSERVIGLDSEGAVVQVDMWDLERHSYSRCPVCVEARLRRLEEMNSLGKKEARIRCADCGAGLSDGDRVGQ